MHSLLAVFILVIGVLTFDSVMVSSPFTVADFASCGAVCHAGSRVSEGTCARRDAVISRHSTLVDIVIDRVHMYS